MNELSQRSKKTFQKFLKENQGSAVLEAVIIIAVVIAIAILFNTQLRTFAEKLIDSVFNNASVLELVK